MQADLNVVRARIARGHQFGTQIQQVPVCGTLLIRLVRSSAGDAQSNQVGTGADFQTCAPKPHTCIFNIRVPTAARSLDATTKAGRQNDPTIRKLGDNLVGSKIRQRPSVCIGWNRFSNLLHTRAGRKQEDEAPKSQASHSNLQVHIRASSLPNQGCKVSRKHKIRSMP